jgi:ribonuclease HI
MGFFSWEKKFLFERFGPMEAAIEICDLSKKTFQQIFKWIKEYSNHPQNERCDTTVMASMQRTFIRCFL